MYAKFNQLLITLSKLALSKAHRVEVWICASDPRGIRTQHYELERLATWPISRGGHMKVPRETLQSSHFNARGLLRICRLALISGCLGQGCDSRIRKSLREARASYHSICPYVLAVGISSFYPLFAPQRASCPHGLSRTAYTFLEVAASSLPTAIDRIGICGPLF